MDATEIVKRHSILESERRNIEGMWTTIERLVVPFRGDFYRDINSENMVEWIDRYKFDDTAVESCNTLSASIQGAITSPMVRWFGLRYRVGPLNKNPEAMAWLSDCADAVYFALQQSNFNLQMSESYLDLCSFGTTVLVEEVELQNNEYEKLIFRSIPIRESYFEEDVEGNVVNFYRKLEWTCLQIVNKFGEENVPRTIREQYKNSQNVTTKHTIIFCIYQRDDKKNVDVSSTLTAKERPYGYKYILLKSKEELGEEGGYYEMPVFVTRWGKASGSKWGYSPATICLGDILTLNQLVKMILVAAEKVVDPATLAQERAIIGDMNLGASGVTIVRQIDGIKPYESKARFDVSALERRELQESIRRAFKVDQLELKESPAMTATEVQVRYELMQRLLGPTLGRLQSDLLDPLIQRTFFILYRTGQLPKMPKAVSDNPGGLEIEYLGPMAKAQKMDKVLSMQRWFQVAAPIAEYDSSIMDLPDVDAIGKEAAVLLDVPLKTDGTVKKIREDRRKEQARMKELAQSQAEGEAMQSVGGGMKAVREGGGNPEQSAAGQVG